MRLGKYRLVVSIGGPEWGNALCFMRNLHRGIQLVQKISVLSKLRGFISCGDLIVVSFAMYPQASVPFE